MFRRLYDIIEKEIVDSRQLSSTSAACSGGFRV
jgi:hypothetical protein